MNQPAPPVAAPTAPPPEGSAGGVLIHALTVLAFALVAGGGGFALGAWWKGRPATTAGGGFAFPPVQVAVAAVRSETLPVAVEAVGTLRAAEVVELTARAAGIIAKLDLPEGSEVAADAVLVELDAEAAEAALREAQVRRDNARREQALAEGLLARGVGTADNLAQRAYQVAVAETQVAQAQARRDDLRIVAPFAGRLGLRQVSLGALVAPGTVVATLVQDGTVELSFAVPERHLASLRPGLAVSGRSAAFPGRAFAGRLTAVDARIDPSTRAVTVQAELPNADRALRAGLFVDVELVVDEIAGALLVPEEAVVVSGNQASVFVIADGKAEGRPIRLGRRRRGAVQVVEGLKAGEQVAVRGLQFLRPGAAVVLADSPPAAPARPAADAPATPAAGDATKKRQSP